MMLYHFKNAADQPSTESKFAAAAALHKTATLNVFLFLIFLHSHFIYFQINTVR